MRKVLPFLVIALALTFRCSQLYQAQHLANNCPDSGHSTDPPIVCIDPSTFGVSQDTVHLSSGMIPGRKIGNFFITGGKGTLKITCEPGTPVDYLGNPTPDHFILRAQPGGTGKHYTYTVSINGRTADPDMEIDP